ncbi:MAG: beta-galactosidase [Bacteroidales bacterium]|nr:beta-galactosidase [Bacteroidales bacterium]
MKKQFIYYSLTLLVLLLASCQEKRTPETFEIGNKTFLLNNEPFIIKAAEIHYPRIPEKYWEHRIEMCKALGMNTICLYIFWNIHEPVEGQFDFSGNNDVAKFCKLAQKHGMYVILRPGPYVCAEWEMGGLPWWLLKKKDIKLRDNDPYFMEKTRLYMEQVGKQLADMQLSKGGNVLMVQVENEYGAYNENKEYIAAMRDIVRESGFDEVSLFQCDWSSNFKKNGLDDLLWTINFGAGANIENQFKSLQEARPETPLMCSEFWSGWFDHWGAKHETRSSATLVSGLKEMLDRNISFSLYMTHGGTSFAHWAGGNNPPFTPTCTTYDYDAPIGESGNVTPKYFEIRELLAGYLPEETFLPAIPDSISTIAIPEIVLEEKAYLLEQLPDPKMVQDIQSMEFFDQGWGSILYRTKLPASEEPQLLKITEVKDWAIVFIDGQPVGVLDRVQGQSSLTIPPVQEGAVLDIFVEAMGRVNFGKSIYDWKGITEKVELTGGKETVDLKGWQVYTFPSDYNSTKRFEFSKDSGEKTGPALYRASFNLDKTGDTFIDMSHWNKGMVYINGHNIGRYWKIGPQQTLYMPGCWLKKGKNEIVVLEMQTPEVSSLQGLRQPILDVNQVKEIQKHRTPGETLDLADERPVYSGSFQPGNGWQSVSFNKPYSCRYFALEALNSQKNDDFASVAELEILSEDGKRISRQNWSIVYADSEETVAANNTALNVFDLQESTIWHTAYSETKDKFPHAIVIDLGKEQTITGFEYLPRMEENYPGMIRDFRIYLKTTPFSISK